MDYPLRVLGAYLQLLFREALVCPLFQFLHYFCHYFVSLPLPDLRLAPREHLVGVLLKYLDHLLVLDVGLDSLLLLVRYLVDLHQLHQVVFGLRGQVLTEKVEVRLPLN